MRLPQATLLLLLLPALSCETSGDGGVLDENAPPRNDVAIVQNAMDLGSNAFAPATAFVKVGETVTWYNADVAGGYEGGGGTPHYLMLDDGSVESGEVAPDGVFKAKFEAPGTYTYHCLYHEGMTGTIVVEP